MASDLGDAKSSTDSPLRVPSHGNGRLQVGNPGNRGGGRPRSEFRDWARSILTDPATTEAVRAVLADPTNRSFAPLWKAVADRAFGPVVQKVKLNGKHEVRGVILLPAASWGAPQAAPQPQPPALDGQVSALPALPAGALDSIVSDVVATIAAAAAARDDDDTEGTV